ncbi:VOC family protein [Myroides sp. JBRI-B21084]|uniref:VOC family protein n=1 Tax=Myroides sp. JBRI-B21084 TaxID=3119977 RepID=UPI0026E34BD3|nr:VOC family protein [Paenimyroides cloacae]WKW46906.1 VOC family protein [Paenimyroides cloacae]
MEAIQFVHLILYVDNQQISTDFYTKLLQTQPVLNVPGMTEFCLAANLKLGLMPNNGIATILKNKTPHPNTGTGIPRCELYLYVQNLEQWCTNAKNIGAVLISDIEKRNWGDTACYFADKDGHIIAFATK